VELDWTKDQPTEFPPGTNPDVFWTKNWAKYGHKMTFPGKLKTYSARKRPVVLLFRLPGKD